MKTIPFYHREKDLWYPSPRPQMAHYDYPDYRSKDIKAQIRELQKAHQEWLAWQFGDNKITIPNETPKKPTTITFAEVVSCPYGFFTRQGASVWFKKPISAQKCLGRKNSKCTKTQYQKCKKIQKATMAYINQDFAFEFTYLLKPKPWQCARRTKVCKIGDCKDCANFQMSEKRLSQLKGEENEKSAETQLSLPMQ